MDAAELKLIAIWTLAAWLAMMIPAVAMHLLIGTIRKQKDQDPPWRKP